MNCETEWNNYDLRYNSYTHNLSAKRKLIIYIILISIRTNISLLKEHVNPSQLSSRDDDDDDDEESALDVREIIQRAHMSNAHSSFVSGKSLEFRLVARLNFPHPVAATASSG